MLGHLKLREFVRAPKTSSLNFTKIYRSCLNEYSISDDVKDTYVLVKSKYDLQFSQLHEKLFKIYRDIHN